MTKRDFLSCLAELGEADAATTAEALGIAYPASAMALLRLVRQGLAAREIDPNGRTYVYWLTDHGRARLTFFEAENATQEERRDTPVSWSRSSPWKGDADMKRKKLHTGTYHCPSCFIEFDLIAEESLRCDQYQGPLAKGPLDDIWDNGDDEGDDEEVEDDE